MGRFSRPGVGDGPILPHLLARGSLLGPSRGAEVIKSVECEDEPDIGLDKSEGMLGSEGQEVERGMGELEA